MVRRSRAQPPHRRLSAAGAGGAPWLLLLLLLLAAGSVHAVRRLPGMEVGWRRLQPAEESAMERAFEGLGRRGLAADATSADAHLVKELPGLAAGALPSRQWAGLLTVDAAAQGKLFYWFFEAEEDPRMKPLLIWLNGGPGCSSMDGLFLENGPFKIDDQQTVTVNPHGWHKAANVLYVDQPVGTGYSFTGTRSYCNDDDCIERHMFAFLQAFFKLHPWLLLDADKAKTRPVFFSGESQAGHYIPSMVDHILTQNARDPLPAGEVVVDVQGMAIGNGWFDPPNQYDVSDFAHGVGMISHGQFLTLQKKRAECVKGLSQGRYFNPVCFALLDEVVAATGTEGTGYVSLYDYRLFDNPGDRQFPPGHKTVEKYLNRAEVKAALNAAESPMVFQECTDPPYDHLKQQDGLGVMGEVKRILESGKVRALFFNGAFDVICNHVGNEAALKQLAWSGQTAFLEAPRGVWLPHGGSGNKPGGYAKGSGALTYLVVLNAGHMVPLDVPAAALDMVRRFMANESFQDKQQAIGMSLEEAPVAAAAVEGAAAPPVAPPSGPPTLKDVKSTGPGEVALTVEPPAGSSSSGGSSSKAGEAPEMWYTIVVNPGGSLLTPTQDHAAGGVLHLKGLKEGIEYSFQAVANTAAGASKPSEPPVALTLGCGGAATGAGDVCQHGLCGFDAAAEAKRCFCYRGWDGAACEVEAAPASAAATTKAGGGNKAGDDAEAAAAADGGVLPPTGRVTFVVDQSCAGDDTQECALRFTVPLHLMYDPAAVSKADRPVSLALGGGEEEGGSGSSSGGWTALDGPEEAKALEGMLRRDLAHAMGVHKEQVALRSLHPLSNATTTDAAAEAGGDKQEAAAGNAAAAMALTFDVLYSPDPAATVQAFTALWAQPQGPLRLGLITSNFDVAKDAEVLLVARDAPLANLPEGAIVNDRPLRRSVAVSLGAFLLIAAVLAVVFRYSRRKLGGVGLGPGGRRAGGGIGGPAGVSMTAMGSGGNGGVNAISVGGAHARVRRRSDTEDLGGGLDSEEDEVVEVMEIRASTDSGSGRSGTGSGRGLGLVGSRPASRSATLDDGASERLV